jgi:hypothetical protein
MWWIDARGQMHPIYNNEDTSYRPQGYAAVHIHVTQERGPAKEYCCTFCSNPAEHWAYNHKDLKAVRDERTWCEFSRDTQYYIPLCILCHKQFDLTEPHLPTTCGC